MIHRYSSGRSPLKDFLAARLQGARRYDRIASPTQLIKALPVAQPKWIGYGNNSIQYLTEDFIDELRHRQRFADRLPDTDRDSAQSP